MLAMCGAARASSFLPNLVYTNTGPLAMTTDGLGTVSGSGTLRTEIPAGATVDKAILLVTTPTLDGVFSTGSPPNVEFEGQALVNPYFSDPGGPSPTALFDVTSIVDAGYDPSTSAQDWSFLELEEVEAAALAVSYSHPGLSEGAVIFMAAGFRAGQFNLGLTPPLPVDLSAPVLLSVGIDSSLTGPGVTGWSIEVGGQKLASVAGARDDGLDADGARVTVGGVGDSPANPVSNSTDYSQDDELYTLNDYLADGATNIPLDFSAGASDAGRLFFVGLQLNSAMAVPEAPRGVEVVTAMLLAVCWGAARGRPPAEDDRRRARRRTSPIPSATTLR